VAETASCVSFENYVRYATFFDLDIDQLMTSYERIPFPTAWKLRPGAGLHSNQWLSLSETPHQGRDIGGRSDRSTIGVGETHPSAVLELLNFESIDPRLWSR
jgi:hypothetical protein